jgi:hypothetical protein
MSEWWTYQLTDFLLFSPRTYYRLFELYNAAIWPAQIVALVLGALCAVLIWRAQPHNARIVWLLLALVWVWTAIAFQLDRYATINWVALYVAVAFLLEAFFMFLLVVRDRPFENAPSLAQYGGYAIILVALTYPLIAVALGRPLIQAEAFGVAPDPTALATIGILLAAQRTPWFALLIPLLWLIFSTLTLIAMDVPDQWTLGALTAACIALAAWKTLTTSAIKQESFRTKPHEPQSHK